MYISTLVRFKSSTVYSFVNFLVGYKIGTVRAYWFFN